jgi:hypothetical protein
MYADGLAEVTGAFSGLLNAGGDFCEKGTYIEQYSHEPNVATSRYWATHGVEMTEEPASWRDISAGTTSSSGGATW